MATYKFRGPSEPLSNLFPFHFVWKGIPFGSLEAAYQWEKATRLGFQMKAIQIRLHHDPTFGVMRLGQQLPDSEMWRSIKLDVMFSLLKAKYQQCPHYHQFLRDTPMTHFQEDTKHPFWGGRRGQNWLGRLHTEIKTMGRTVLIVGSSHAREMANFLSTAAEGNGGLFHFVDEPIPGATVDGIRRWITRNDLSAYDYIFPIIGSNDFYNKYGIHKADGKDVANCLKELFAEIQHKSPRSTVIRTAVLPRATDTCTQAQSEFFPRQCRETAYCNTLLTVDVRLPALWRTRSSGDAQYFSTDSVHLNEAGKMYIADAWAAFL
jgi:predicted NAD-dependent protein-ADP-ribosyltransferase YbiA (DUF1768 family)